MEGNKGSSSLEIKNLLTSYGASNSIGLNQLFSRFNGGFHFLDTFRGIGASDIMDYSTKFSALNLVPIAEDQDN